ncbi:hypothetical protein BS47DRAFT_856851 [Hydnum rufescens UP504]|uniref:Uncharacterized protein n=1 Tax=Hydnum rufescens UP504 TaxID=1448309 RepID=A0A9P6AZ57_9AGAM|nr:hypothetical protein BS47DRAFT_856851 [Hydnum rufescens UP504]
MQRNDCLKAPLRPIETRVFVIPASSAYIWGVSACKQFMKFIHTQILKQWLIQPILSTFARVRQNGSSSSPVMVCGSWSRDLFVQLFAPAFSA